MQMARKVFTVPVFMNRTSLQDRDGYGAAQNGGQVVDGLVEIDAFEASYLTSIRSGKHQLLPGTAISTYHRGPEGICRNTIPRTSARSFKAHEFHGL